MIRKLRNGKNITSSTHFGNGFIAIAKDNIKNKNHEIISSIPKQLAARDGLKTLFELAKKYKLKIAVGTDIVGPPVLKKEQAKELSNRLPWFTPAEILKQATANNAELLSWSGPRNPYPGKLGVIEEGALADILLVDGNPLENLHLFDDPDKNLALIMKDGKIYKNTTQ